ncbi:MAG: DUF4375 domain-containing protein [Limisphaerales bacterium]
MKLLVVATVLLVIGLAAMMLIRRKTTEGGFKQYISDSEYRDSLHAQFQERLNAKAPENIDEQGIEALVEKLLDPRDPTFATEQLRSLNERAVPMLVRALSDRRFFTEVEGEYLFPSAPAVKVVRLLEPLRPEAAIEPLASMLDEKPKYLRQAAAHALGFIAKDECIATLQNALAAPEDYVRTYAMMGIQKAVKDQQGSTQFRSAIFESIIPLLNRKDNSMSEAPETLLILDPIKGAAAMSDDRVLNLTNPILTQCLYALNKHQAVVPADRLHHLMQGVRDDLSTYPNDAIYGESLIALARTADPALDALIQETLKHSNKRLVESAAQALSVQKGVGGIMDKIWRRYSAEEQLSRLTDVEQNIIGVRLLIDQVNNGGFSQYFFNSSGDHIEETFRGLQAIKAPETEALLRKAIQVFGRGGPSPNRDKRMGQMEKFSSKADAQLDALNDAFFKDNENREAKLELYIAEQSEMLKALADPK